MTLTKNLNVNGTNLRDVGVKRTGCYFIRGKVEVQFSDVTWNMLDMGIKFLEQYGLKRNIFGNHWHLNYT